MWPKSPFKKHCAVELQLMPGHEAALRDYLPWLTTPPSVTTYRLNLTKYTFDNFALHLQKMFYPTCPPPQVFQIPELPEVVCIGPVKKISDDVLHSDEYIDKEVMVDARCGAALLRGAHLYAPGVMAMETKTQLGAHVKTFADLSGKCRKGTNTRYEDSSDKLFIGLGVVRMQRHQLYSPHRREHGIAVEMLRTVGGVPSLGDLSDSNALLQNLPSIICVRVLSPQPNERILDMCAAPGNKTTHIAELMANTGLIVALDKTEIRIKLVREKIAQSNWTNIRAYSFDSTKACSMEDSARDEMPPFARNNFDRILLDAPCSGLGNRPILVNSMTVKMLNSFPIIQRKLLSNAVQLLRPGGVLVYSTCTIAVDENENMVAWALKQFSELELVPATPIFGGKGLSNMGLSDEQRAMVQRFGPDALNRISGLDTIGFFIAKFLKKAE